MKGLFTYYNDATKMEEALTLCKQGLALDMKSHVTWHVYGILYRAVDNQKMAIKCYNNRAACYKQLSNFDGTIGDSTSVLEYKPDDIKVCVTMPCDLYLIPPPY
jgi:two-component SAPR family response regulator